MQRRSDKAAAATTVAKIYDKRLIRDPTYFFHTAQSFRTRAIQGLIMFATDIIFVSFFLFWSACFVCDKNCAFWYSSLRAVVLYMFMYIRMDVGTEDIK